MVPIRGGLRCSAIDGVTPWRARPWPGDAAQYAAETLASALRDGATAPRAFTQANATLWDGSLALSRQQSMCAAIAVDVWLVAEGVRGDWVLAGDCELWAADEAGRLLLVAGGAYERGPSHAELERLPRSYRDDDPGPGPHAVGRYRSSDFPVGRVTAAALVLASDGARLAEATGQGVELSGLAAWLDCASSVEGRDDLTCIVVEPS